MRTRWLGGLLLAGLVTVGVSACANPEAPAIVVGDLTYTEADLTKTVSQWRALNKVLDAPMREEIQKEIADLREQHRVAQAEGNTEAMQQVYSELAAFSPLGSLIARPEPSLSQAASILVFYGVAVPLAQMAGLDLEPLSQADLVKAFEVPADQVARLPKFTLTTRQALTTWYTVAMNDPDPSLVPVDLIDRINEAVALDPQSLDVVLNSVWVAPRVGRFSAEQGIAVEPSSVTGPWAVWSAANPLLIGQ